MYYTEFLIEVWKLPFRLGLIAVFAVCTNLEYPQSSITRKNQSHVGRPDNGPLTGTVVCTTEVLQHVPKNKFDQVGS